MRATGMGRRRKVVASEGQACREERHSGPMFPRSLADVRWLLPVLTHPGGWLCVVSGEKSVLFGMAH